MKSIMDFNFMKQLYQAGPVAVNSLVSSPTVNERASSRPRARAMAFARSMTTVTEDEWLWGWDVSPGIVSVWAEADGRATIWRRLPGALTLVREEARFRPWLLLDRLDDLQQQLGARVQPEPSDDRPAPPHAITWRELDGLGALRFLVRGDDGRALSAAVLQGASRRLGRPIQSLRELGQASALALPPEEQYLVASGRNYFRGLAFDDLRRLQLDLETTGLDPTRDRLFLIALRAPDGQVEILEATNRENSGEAALIEQLMARISAHDPDVIENHNLHGFDLPFLARRAETLGVTLSLGRAPGLRRRAAARGAKVGRGQNDPMRRARYTVPGRELVDSMDAVRRHDFATRELPGHGLKAVARHLGLAGDDRELIPGARVYEVYGRDPERVRRYAGADVVEAAGVARLLGGAAFALARMAPRRYERLADAGAATGVLDPLLVRAYLRAGAALPAHQPGDGTPHSGAALHLFAAGVAERIVKADVASLYPSLMRQYRIGPMRDRLGALLTMVDRLVEQRLQAKAAAKKAPPGSPERHTHEAMSAAMKIVVNSAYGYLGAVGLTRFADVHAANEVTRRGREVLDLLCRELAAREVTLLEADTDGVYFAVPPAWSEADERRVVAEVAALLPERVHLELDGRYAAMLSHEPKNYALKPYAGPLLLRGVAFRSSRAEPFGEQFLRRALGKLLANDIAGVQAIYIETVLALRRRTIATIDVTARVRLTKTPAQYGSTRQSRREHAYEAALAAGLDDWSAGDSVRVYRGTSGRPRLWPDDRDDDLPDPRDYDSDYYVQLLRDTFAARFARALDGEDFATVFADPAQPSLFAPSLAQARPILTRLAVPTATIDARMTLDDELPS